MRKSTIDVSLSRHVSRCRLARVQTWDDAQTTPTPTHVNIAPHTKPHPSNYSELFFLLLLLLLCWAFRSISLRVFISFHILIAAAAPLRRSITTTIIVSFALTPCRNQFPENASKFVVCRRWLALMARPMRPYQTTTKKNDTMLVLRHSTMLVQPPPPSPLSHTGPVHTSSLLLLFVANEWLTSCRMLSYYFNLTHISTDCRMAFDWKDEARALVVDRHFKPWTCLWRTLFGLGFSCHFPRLIHSWTINKNY